MNGKITVLFLCTENSCRSQMAEGFTRALKDGLIDVYSAGIEPHGLDPLTVSVVKEVGVDISGHISKNVSDFNIAAIDDSLHSHQQSKYFYGFFDCYCYLPL